MQRPGEGLAAAEVAAEEEVPPGRATQRRGLSSTSAAEGSELTQEQPALLGRAGVAAGAP